MERNTAVNQPRITLNPHNPWLISFQNAFVVLCARVWVGMWFRALTHCCFALPLMTSPRGSDRAVVLAAQIAAHAITFHSYERLIPRTVRLC